MKAIIGHIILNVKDFNESELFYDRFFLKIGFEINHFEDWDFGKIKSYKQGEHNLWIRFVDNEESKPFVRNVGLDHLAFQLNNKSEVDEVYNLLKTMNTEITRKPQKYPDYSKTYYAFYFRDPNGIPLEVYTP